MKTAAAAVAYLLVNAWIARAGLDELTAIVYGAELPNDLAASMAAIIAAAGGGTA